MTESKTNFSETQSASELLDQFHSLTLRPARRITRSRTEAASAFFNKDFLTIADFFGPIGEILVVAAPAKADRAGSVEQFITSNLHRSKRPQGPKLVLRNKETIGAFFSKIDE